MQPAVILGCKTDPPRNGLGLLLPVPIYRDNRSDGTAITSASLEIEPNPVARGVGGVLVQKKRAVLIRNDSIQNTTIPEVG